MKKAIAIISTDWHLQHNNIDRIKNLFEQQCFLAKELGVSNLYCLGDVFESRIAQRQDVLIAFEEMLEMLVKYDLDLFLIPGNHDKTDYSHKNSFLAPFKHHKKLILIDLMGFTPNQNSDVTFYMIPFFSEDVWVNKFNELVNDDLHFDKNDGKKKILLTHIAVTGSRNNDGSLVSSGISTKMFKDFFKVFSGHYHDQQKIGQNFYHIPALRQNNFGEDDQKGFTVVYDDGSHELVVSHFPKYINLKFDLDKVEYIDIINSRKLFDLDNDYIRFTIIGSENKLKAINKEDFTSVGIDVKLINKDVEETLKVAEEEIQELNSSLIVDEFKKFCEKEKLNEEQGLIYLKQILKWN